MFGLSYVVLVHGCCSYILINNALYASSSQKSDKWSLSHLRTLYQLIFFFNYDELYHRSHLRKGKCVGALCFRMSYFVVEKAQGINMRQSAGYSVYNHTGRLGRQSWGRLNFFSPVFLSLRLQIPWILLPTCRAFSRKCISQVIPNSSSLQ